MFRRWQRSVRNVILNKSSVDNHRASDKPESTLGLPSEAATDDGDGGGGVGGDDNDNNNNTDINITITIATLIARHTHTYTCTRARRQLRIRIWIRGYTDKYRRKIQIQIQMHAKRTRKSENVNGDGDGDEMTATTTTKAKATVTRSRCSPMYVRTRTGCGWLLTTGTRADRYECRCSGLRPNQHNTSIPMHAASTLQQQQWQRERDNATSIMLAPLRSNTSEHWKRQRRQRRRPPSHATGGGGECHRCRSSSHTHTRAHSCAARSHSSPRLSKGDLQQQLEVLALELLAANQSDAFAGLLFFIAFPPALH